MYRVRDAAVEVLLVHPGGPYWRTRDAGAWSVPKGEIVAGDDPLATARREFEEETGLRPGGPFHPLGSVRQKGGKVVQAWAFEGDADPRALTSNTFTMEWPPRSGRRQEFPEVDRAEFLAFDVARRKLGPAQVPFLDRLRRLVGQSG